MYEQDIKYLRKCLEVGLKVWYNAKEGWVEISYIGDNKDENWPVAYRPDGKYHALEVCEKLEFMVTSGALTDFPTDREPL